MNTDTARSGQIWGPNFPDLVRFPDVEIWFPDLAGINKRTIFFFSFVQCPASDAR